jgi:hypothetical protein
MATIKYRKHRLRHDPPPRVYIICYLIFCAAALELTRATVQGYFPRDGVPPIKPLLFVIIFVHSFLAGFCAYFMLQGANWARILFYVVSVINVLDVLGLGISPDIAIPGAELFVAGAILATSRANRFFAGKNPDAPFGDPYRRRKSDLLPPPRPREGRYDY